MLKSVFLSSLFIFIGTYLAYFLYLRKYVGKAWNIKVDGKFEPEVSILIPVHNEEANIESKLENTVNVLYPKEKMEIIVADDASNDNTVKKVENFMSKHPDLTIKFVRLNPRVGKSAALNRALQVSTKPVVIVSDADTRWPSDILRKAMPYLADPNVGAITGRGVNVNVLETWVTKAEESYLQLANFVRLGESKIHSTIKFEGGFCAYKRAAFDLFECETGSDDSGTALNVISKGYRTIMVPEVVFYTSFPPSFIAKFKIKIRRANQLIGLWNKCLNLLFHGKLFLPKQILIPEIILFIFNPIIFLILVASGAALIIMNPFSFVSLAVIFSFFGSLILARHVLVEFFIDNVILACGLLTFILGRRYVVWERGK
jgi:cellulose synthase/poly-beta-1,6-N-acetylglucosamine synthase-like glycosyltransferase